MKAKNLKYCTMLIFEKWFQTVRAKIWFCYVQSQENHAATRLFIYYISVLIRR